MITVSVFGSGGLGSGAQDVNLKPGQTEQTTLSLSLFFLLCVSGSTDEWESNTVALK